MLVATHSVRFRIKNPQKLAKKILTKKKKDPTRSIKFENYKSEITDLIGLRVLHLFKEDWTLIHDFIVKKWDLFETPIAYFRTGDNEDWVNAFNPCSGNILTKSPNITGLQRLKKICSHRIKTDMFPTSAL